LGARIPHSGPENARTIQWPAVQRQDAPERSNGRQRCVDAPERAAREEGEIVRMSEQKVVSRRSILTLAGGSVIGAAAMSASAAGVRRDDLIVPNARLINHQPIPPFVEPIHIEATTPEQSNDFGAVLITRVPRYIITGQTMIPEATIQVDRQFIGQQYTLRLGIQEDTGEPRTETQTDSAAIPSEAFTVQISKGDNLPGDDWNLSADRLFVILSTFNVLHARAFSFAPLYPFKIVEA
jgi:hypothetical protein